MITYVIIDDEPIAHRIIERYCESLLHLTKIGNCFNAFEAIQLLNQRQVDLIFLDINMPKLSGFEFLKTLSKSPKIIVTTAYEEFALEGYALDVSDYLLKPFSFERFIKAVNKTIVHESIVQKPPTILEPSARSLFIKGDKKIHQIYTNDILFVEAYGNYTKINTITGMILSHEKISDLENDLPKDQFLRVHKSFIVAINKIMTIEGNQIIITENKIPIGQTYKKLVNELFK